MKEVLDICEDCGKEIYVGELVVAKVGEWKKRCLECESKSKGEGNEL